MSYVYRNKFGQCALWFEQSLWVIFEFVQLYLSDGPLDHDHDMEKLLYGCKTSKEMYVLFCRYLALPVA